MAAYCTVEHDWEKEPACDCKWPKQGKRVRVVLPPEDGPLGFITRVPGGAEGGDDEVAVLAGWTGTVVGMVREWFDIHVQLDPQETLTDEQHHVWISPDRLEAA